MISPTEHQTGHKDVSSGLMNNFQLVHENDWINNLSGFVVDSNNRVSSLKVAEAAYVFLQKCPLLMAALPLYGDLTMSLFSRC